MRKTKIICTMGPATDNIEVLRAMARAGMNVARFNFSHGSHEEHKQRIDRVNEEALLEKKRVVDEMKQEMISVAAAMAAKVINANIDINIQNQLVDETIKEMGDSTWLS